MTTTLLKGDLVTCPHCLRNQEDSPVEDFVVPGKIGQLCAEECCWCYAEFHVTQLNYTLAYEVSKGAA